MSKIGACDVCDAQDVEISFAICAGIETYACENCTECADDAPSITDAPMDEERVRKHAPQTLLALIWLFGLEAAEDKTTEEFKQERLLALRAADLAITESTGMQP